MIDRTDTPWSDKEDVVMVLAVAANCDTETTKQMLREMAHSTRNGFEIAAKVRDMRARAEA